MTTPTTTIKVNLVASLTKLAPTSQRTYVRWIKRYLADTYQLPSDKFRLDDIRLEILTTSLQPTRVRRWLDHLKDNEKLSSASLTQARCTLVWVAQQLADAEHLDYLFPATLSRLPVPSVVHDGRAKTWLTKEQVQQLLDALTTLSDRPALKARNTAIIVLMVTCGLRRDEVAAARWGDLEYIQHKLCLNVRGKGNKRRLVALPQITIDALEAWKKFHPMPHGEHFIFTALKKNLAVTTYALTGAGILNIVEQAGSMADLDITPHDLRRTFAKGAYETGTDYEAIRQTLGHENMSTTQGYIGQVETEPTSNTWADSMEL